MLLLYTYLGKEGAKSQVYRTNKRGRSHLCVLVLCRLLPYIMPAERLFVASINCGRRSFPLVELLPSFHYLI